MLQYGKEDMIIYTVGLAVHGEMILGLLCYLLLFFIVIPYKLIYKLSE